MAAPLATTATNKHYNTMELKDAKYLDSILMRGGTSAINVDDVPDNIIRMLATYRYIRIVDKRSDGIAYLVETTDEGGQFLARGGFQGLIMESEKKESDQAQKRKFHWLEFLIGLSVSLLEIFL